MMLDELVIRTSTLDELVKACAEYSRKARLKIEARMDAHYHPKLPYRISHSNFTLMLDSDKQDQYEIDRVARWKSPYHSSNGSPQPAWMRRLRG